METSFRLPRWIDRSSPLSLPLSLLVLSSDLVSTRDFSRRAPDIDRTAPLRGLDCYAGAVGLGLGVLLGAEGGVEIPYACESNLNAAKSYACVVSSFSFLLAFSTKRHAETFFAPFSISTAPTIPTLEFFSSSFQRSSRSSSIPTNGNG